MENTDVMGASANFADVRNIDVAQGRFITPADDEHRSEVVFIGADLASKFFPNVDPIGKTIRAETHSYQVIGVAEPFGSAFGQSQDNYMIIPLNTYMKEWHRQKDWLTIFVQAPNLEMMQTSEDEARMLLRAWRKVPYDAKDNFAILGSDSIMALWHDLTGNLAFVASALVSVFLVVGGIVIMNIMLASVTERTREIGLRRSLGSRKQHIILQFMTESAVLAAVGGLIGILSAYLVVNTVQALFSFPMNTPIGSVILSLGVSTGVGLFFGIYPAMLAAKLDPIEALRAEGQGGTHGAGARRKSEAGHGHAPRAQDAQRADGIRCGPGRERDYARCRAALRLRPEDSGANQAVWGGHRLHCQMGSGPARRAATARRTSTQAAHPRRRQSHPRRLPGGQECDRLSANALGPGARGAHQSRRSHGHRFSRGAAQFRPGVRQCLDGRRPLHQRGRRSSPGESSHARRKRRTGAVSRGSSCRERRQDRRL